MGQRTIYIRKMRYAVAKDKLEHELQKAFLDGVTMIEVVHGIGTGALKNMVEQTVLESGLGQIMENDPMFTNPGTTFVQLFPPGQIPGVHIERA